MNTTASPRPSAVIGQTAKFIRALETVDVTSADLQRVIDDPEFRATIAAAFGHPVDAAYVDAGTLSVQAIGRVLDRIYATSKNAQDDFLDPERLRFRSPKEFQPLLDCLTSPRRRIVCVVFGLLDDTSRSDREAAELMGMTVARIRTNVAKACQQMASVISDMHRQQREQVNNFPAGLVTRTTPIYQFKLALSPMLRNALKGLADASYAGKFSVTADMLVSVGDLLDACDYETAKSYIGAGSYEFMGHDRGSYSASWVKVETPYGAKHFDELVEKLAVHGLAFRSE